MEVFILASSSWQSNGDIIEESGSRIERRCTRGGDAQTTACIGAAVQQYRIIRGAFLVSRLRRWQPLIRGTRRSCVVYSSRAQGFSLNSRFGANNRIPHFTLRSSSPASQHTTWGINPLLYPRYGMHVLLCDSELIRVQSIISAAAASWPKSRRLLGRSYCSYIYIYIYTRHIPQYTATVSMLSTNKLHD